VNAARRASRRGVVTASLTALCLWSLAPTAAAVVDDGPPEEPEGGISGSDIRGSVRVFDGDAVRTFSTEDHVHSLGDRVESSGGETTISLSSDLLFAENSWELPTSAPDQIAELVQDVPDGSTVAVTGHTDSQQPIGQDFDNDELSENRAEAVAEVLSRERSDLNLEISGVGDSEPAATGSEDDPQTHAANRRVEVVYSE